MENIYKLECVKPLDGHLTVGIMYEFNEKKDKNGQLWITSTDHKISGYIAKEYFKERETVLSNILKVTW